MVGVQLLVVEQRSCNPLDLLLHRGPAKQQHGSGLISTQIAPFLAQGLESYEVHSQDLHCNPYGFDAMVYSAGRTAEAAVAASAKQMALNAAITTLLAPVAFAELAAPAVTDAKLARIISRIYKGQSGKSIPIGSGSTADAIRNEMMTGMPTFGTFHTQAGKELARSLENWIAQNPNAARGEVAIAKELLRDLRNALAGR